MHISTLLSDLCMACDGQQVVNYHRWTGSAGPQQLLTHTSPLVLHPTPQCAAQPCIPPRGVYPSYLWLLCPLLVDDLQVCSHNGTHGGLAGGAALLAGNLSHLVLLVGLPAQEQTYSSKNGSRLGRHMRVSEISSCFVILMVTTTRCPCLAVVCGLCPMLLMVALLTCTRACAIEQHCLVAAHTTLLPLRYPVWTHMPLG